MPITIVPYKVTPKDTSHAHNLVNVSNALNPLTSDTYTGYNDMFHQPLHTMVAPYVETKNTSVPTNLKPFKKDPVNVKLDNLASSYPAIPPKDIVESMGARVFRWMLNADVKDGQNVVIPVNYISNAEDDKEAFENAQYSHKALQAGVTSVDAFLRVNTNIFEIMHDAMKNHKKYLNEPCPKTIKDASTKGYLTPQIIEKLPPLWRDQLITKMTLEDFAIALDKEQNSNKQAEKFADIQLRVKNGTIKLIASDTTNKNAALNNATGISMMSHTHLDYFESNKTEIEKLYQNLQDMANNESTVPLSKPITDFDAMNKNAKNLQEKKTKEKTDEATAKNKQKQTEQDAEKGKFPNKTVFTMEDIINQLILLKTDADKQEYLKYVSGRIESTSEPATFNYDDKTYLDKEIPGLNGVKYKDYYEGNKDFLNSIDTNLKYKEDARRTTGAGDPDTTYNVGNTTTKMKKSALNAYANTEITKLINNNFTANPPTISKAVDNANQRIAEEYNLKFQQEKITNTTASPQIHTPIHAPANDDLVRSQLRVVVTNNAATASTPPKTGASKAATATSSSATATTAAAAAAVAGASSSIKIATTPFMSAEQNKRIIEVLNKAKSNNEIASYKIPADGTTSGGYEVEFKDAAEKAVISDKAVTFPPGKEDFAISAILALVQPGGPTPEVILTAKNADQLKELIDKCGDKVKITSATITSTKDEDKKLTKGGDGKDFDGMTHAKEVSVSLAAATSASTSKSAAAATK